MIRLLRRVFDYESTSPEAIVQGWEIRVWPIGRLEFRRWRHVRRHEITIYRPHGFTLTIHLWRTPPRK